MVRRIFDESEVVIEGCRILCIEIHVYYFSPDSINIIIARKIICMWRLACIE